jgi:hypothetical protein
LPVASTVTAVIDGWPMATARAHHAVDSVEIAAPHQIAQARWSDGSAP